ncbi:MAG: dihydroneopterin aldolase [Clostridiales bacterium]|nr:dihydroneopterin aldolase [Clostridiales bacterium]
MDKIIVKGLKVFAYHGVNSEEKENGQNFIIDASVSTYIYKASCTDDLNETVSYAKIIKTIKRVMLEKKYDLIESVAQRIAEQIFEEYPSVEEVTVAVKKPQAPISADFDYVAVEITRKRESLKNE